MCDCYYSSSGRQKHQQTCEGAKESVYLWMPLYHGGLPTAASTGFGVSSGRQVPISLAYLFDTRQSAKPPTHATPAELTVPDYVLDYGRLRPWNDSKAVTAL